MEIWSRKIKSTKIISKLDLGRSCVPLGEGLGCSWASPGRFWASPGCSWVPFDCFLVAQKPAFCKHESKIDSKMPFGSIWHRFWKGFRSLEGSGKGLGKVLKEDGAIQDWIKIDAVHRGRAVSPRSGLNPPAPWAKAC